MSDGRIGPYRLLRKLSQGGMGTVYECVHEAIERRVAIKILNAEYTRNADAVSRFFNEARAVNRIDHPGLVQVHDHGQLPDGTAYIVMEFLKGETLGRRVRKAPGSLSLHQILRLLRQVADTLAAAHAKEIVHRDLKLDNIMLVPDPAIPGGERTKLLDFGIAKLREPTVKLAATRGDLLMGTPGYMSPEQCRGAAGVDDRSDVYSLGVVLYRLLAGRMPFVAAGAGEIMAMHIYEEPPPLRGFADWVPEPVDEFVHVLLKKDKAARPPMTEGVSMLDSLLASVPDVQPPPRQMSASTAEHAAMTPNSDVDSGAGADSPSIMPTVDGGDDVGSSSSQDGAPPLSAPSTLAVSVGQQRTLQSVMQRRLLYGALALGTTALLGIGFFMSKRPGKTAHGPNSPTHTAQTSASTGMGPTPTATVSGTPNRRMVRWSLVTDPAGAVVTRVSDGAILGLTPWSAEFVAATGVEELRLKLPGYAERLIQLDRSSDASRTDALDAVGSTSSTVPAPADGPKHPEGTPPPTPKPRRDGTRKKPKGVAIELED